MLNHTVWYDANMCIFPLSAICRPHYPSHPQSQRYSSILSHLHSCPHVSHSWVSLGCQLSWVGLLNFSHYTERLFWRRVCQSYQKYYYEHPSFFTKSWCRLRVVKSVQQYVLRSDNFGVQTLLYWIITKWVNNFTCNGPFYTIFGARCILILEQTVIWNYSCVQILEIDETDILLFLCCCCLMFLCCSFIIFTWCCSLMSVRC